MVQIAMNSPPTEPATGPFLEPKARHHAFDIPGWLRVARDHHEGGTFGVVRDIATLAFGPGRLKPYEYFFMGLYEGDRIDAADRRRFMGDRARVVLHRQAIESEWLAVTYDKLLFLLAMRGQGLPVPEVRAIFHPGRNFADAACLGDPDAVARWLREEAAYPFFSKPVESTGSAGTASIDAYDGAADALVSADGRRVSVEQFAREVGRYRERGYLFQERIATHPEIAPVCGPGVSACRMLVRIEDGKPVLHRATWKIPAGANMADNFWRDGNMLGALDPETGEVTRVVQGMAVDAVEMENHPDTGMALKGFRLPEWDAMKETCLKAAATFPPLWLQGWDVALSDRGPVLFEVEGDGGGAQMTQHAQGCGLLDDDFVAFLERWKKAAGDRRQRLTGSRKKR
jgi:hypothetical protein